MINKIFFKTFQKEMNFKTNHKLWPQNLKAQVSLVNLLKALAQAINIVVIRLLIDKIKLLFHYLIAYAVNQQHLSI